ncbi:hypothetical protein KCU67_g6903, partial [Aureobasidium melanogenum]
MAVLDGLPGVEVTVVVDGQDLHEYQDADMEDDEDTVTKYIEAVDNANFAIKIKVSEDVEFKGDCLSFDISVDGVHIDRPLVSGPISQEVLRVADGVRVGSEHIRKLKFNALEIVDKHGFGLPKDLDRVKDLGKIKIRVTHQNKIRQTFNKIYSQPDRGSEEFISEKAIKGHAVTHSYSLDKETYKPKTSFWDTEFTAEAKNPAAKFVFHYRSKAALKELMIIPRTPSPVPLEDRPLSELSPEQMAELVLQLKAKVANTAAIKRERADENDNNSRARKRARSSASADPVHLELNDDDDTFTEVAVAPKEKTIISLDD